MISDKELEQKSKVADYPMGTGIKVKYAAEHGYTLGWRACEASPEYQQMKEGAEKWQQVWEVLQGLHEEDRELWRQEEIDLIGEKVLKIAGEL